MITTTEEEFIELKLNIKDTIENVKNDLKNIDICLGWIDHFQTLLKINDKLLGISFNLKIANSIVLNEDYVIKNIMDNLFSRICKMYIKEVK